MTASHPFVAGEGALIVAGCDERVLSAVREKVDDMPKNVKDLMRVTGWSRGTVLAALKAGRLPGYLSAGGGKWTVPDDAFARFEAGTWRPPLSQKIIVRPKRKGE